MAFHHRKLLLQNHYQFPPSPAPSPLQSPLSLLKPLPLELPDLPLPEDDHLHALVIAMIITSCLVGVLLFFCTFSVLRRVYYNSSIQNNDQDQNRAAAPILFDFNDDSSVAEDEEPVIEHPIWLIRTVGLNQSLIDSITVFKYRKDDALIDGTECSVCLGEFEEDESLRLLPKCSHAFHIPCIDTWLRSHKNCPLCRAPVFHETEDRVTEQSQEAETEDSVGGEGEGSSNRVGEIESGEMRIEIEDDGGFSRGIQDKMLGNSGGEETEEPIRRSVSMDSCSASMVFRDVALNLNSDRVSSESDTHFGVKMSSSTCSVDLGIGKYAGSGNFSSICNVTLIGRALQKRNMMRRSFSNNRKFLSSRHCRSHSSTLPL